MPRKIKTPLFFIVKHLICLFMMALVLSGCGASGSGASSEGDDETNSSISSADVDLTSVASDGSEEVNGDQPDDGANTSDEQSDEERATDASAASDLNTVDGDTSDLTVDTDTDSGMSLLSTHGTSIVDESGQAIQLKGFNLGGWFVLENYMAPVDASDEPATDSYSVMAKLNERFGVETQRALMKVYQETGITASDIETIAAAGFNVVRIPLWWGQFFDLDNASISGFRSDGFDVLDRIVEACRDNGVYVILDLHGAIGGQSLHFHTGQADSNTLWSDSQAQSMTAWLWWQIANHYKGNKTIAGFDLLNEPDVRTTSRSWTAADTEQVWEINDRFYRAVRDADAERMIIIEGTFGNWNWNQLPDPADYGWTNVVYEMHEYQWDSNGGTSTDIATIKAGIDKQVADFENHAGWNVPGYIGEFNVFNGGAEAWQYAIQAYNRAGLSWSMWSYKAVNGVAPNFWGWYDPYYWPQRPNLDTDIASEVERKWRLWSTTDTFDLNTALGITP